MNVRPIFAAVILAALATAAGACHQTAIMVLKAI